MTEKCGWIPFLKRDTKQCVACSAKYSELSRKHLTIFNLFDETIVTQKSSDVKTRFHKEAVKGLSVEPPIFVGNRAL